MAKIEIEVKELLFLRRRVERLRKKILECQDQIESANKRIDELKFAIKSKEEKCKNQQSDE